MAHGPLFSDLKTIADSRKDNGHAIRQVCDRFVAHRRTMGLFTEASVAIDGGKFKAVNNRDKNFTRAKMERCLAQIEEGVARYLHQLDSADRQEPIAGAHDEDDPPPRDDRKSERGEGAAPPCTPSGDTRHTGPADIAERARS